MINTKQKIIIPVVVVLCLAAFSLFILKQRAGHVGNFPEDMPELVVVELANAPAAPIAGTGSGFLPTSMESPERFAALNKNLNAMGECLGLKVQPLSSQDEFNFETVGRIIAPDMGPVIKVQPKWSVVDSKANGENRRVFVDYSSDPDAPEAEPTKTVHHYTVLVSGKVRDIALPGDLANNPSESDIQKLHADGQLIRTARAVLVTYQNGDELNYVEQNGKAYSVVVSHLGKYFRCKDADSAQMSCSCN